MLFDYKFMRAPKDIVKDMYFGTKAVIQTFSLPYSDTEDLLYEAYDNIKANIDNCYIVKLFGQIAAHYMFRDDGDVAVLSDVYVYRNFRSHGVGTAIIRRCISDTEKPIVAYIHRTNISAMSLFKKHHFVITKEKDRLCRMYLANGNITPKKSVRK
ncbi:MAG: GNAT family N-acetyltransferase [Ruminococcaceae bacterium]|nr:GNAT family N-acetyltransferase [Oscillospiraceae bacterium]